jgi:hypothetical protein
MAARLRKMHTDEIRAKIRTSQLINRLTDHAFDKVELSATQIKSIEILLKKSIPDLSAIQHSGDPDRPVLHRIERTIVDPASANAANPDS